MLRKKITKEQALSRLETLCSRSEQCSFDLTLKLINWGINREERTEILESLKENRYLDDHRFARSYVNDKARFSGWGPFKIKIELAKRKIPSSVIAEALAGVDARIWKDSLLKNAASKAKGLILTGEEGYNDRQKLFRYLVSRGFSSASSAKGVAYMKKLQMEDEEMGQ